MQTNKTNVLLSALAIGLIGLITIPAYAAVVHKVDQDSQFAGHFTVTKEKYYDEIQITVTATKQIGNFHFESLRYSIDGRTRITTNGTELTFTIDPAKLEKAIVYADYTAPNHNPEKTGGYEVYELNISSLAAE